MNEIIRIRKFAETGKFLKMLNPTILHKREKSLLNDPARPSSLMFATVIAA